MKIPVTILNDNKTVEIEQGSSLVQLAKARGDGTLVASVNNEICDLTMPINYPSKVRFFNIHSSAGIRSYRNSAMTIMLMAASRVLGKDERIWVEHTVNTLLRHDGDDGVLAVGQGQSHLKGGQCLRQNHGVVNIQVH